MEVEIRIEAKGGTGGLGLNCFPSRFVPFGFLDLLGLLSSSYYISRGGGPSKGWEDSSGRITG